ncbi:superoxide dismutase family protein [Caloramator sp. E03]|uniref:superoxide dismutase family protein n=1 Tax=Caloramator sp. E03 TaxID=2576307 RepID=UPI001110D774|nr:superoxide dismutase family protein [Caloramator sp. E03]QCX34770.1 superoxide dismutase family protein [Caloramator sp. E03]
MNCCSCYFRSIGYTDQYYAKKAYAHIKGGPLAPNLDGYVYFREVLGGTMVYVDISGLPEFRPAKDNMPQVGPHGFHIHELGNCDVGDVNNPFALAGGHYNPWNQPHGNHAGDFPVLFSNDGIANMSFFTNKFKVADIIGKTIIIHESPDDYRTQPTGASGRRLGCGIIKEM